MYVYLYVCACVYIYINDLLIHTHTYIYMCVCISVCVYMHTHTHTGNMRISDEVSRKKDGTEDCRNEWQTVLPLIILVSTENKMTAFNIPSVMFHIMRVCVVSFTQSQCLFVYPGAAVCFLLIRPKEETWNIFYLHLLIFIVYRTSVICSFLTFNIFKTHGALGCILYYLLLYSRILFSILTDDRNITGTLQAEYVDYSIL